MYSTFFKSHEGPRVKTTLRYFQQSISCHTFFHDGFSIYIHTGLYFQKEKFIFALHSRKL